MNLQSNTPFGQYRIIRLLGRGGMGKVYEAEHRGLHRRYALKVLPQDFAGRTEAVRRFEREAEVMANLEHPHIVRADEFGETEGRYWLRMELVNGVRSADCGLGNGRSADIPVGPMEGGTRKADKNVGAPVHRHVLGRARGPKRAGCYAASIAAADSASSGRTTLMATLPAMMPWLLLLSRRSLSCARTVVNELRLARMPQSFNFRRKQSAG